MARELHRIYCDTHHTIPFDVFDDVFTAVADILIHYDLPPSIFMERVYTDDEDDWLDPEVLCKHAGQIDADTRALYVKDTSYGYCAGKENLSRGLLDYDLGDSRRTDPIRELLNPDSWFSPVFRIAEGIRLHREERATDHQLQQLIEQYGLNAIGELHFCPELDEQLIETHNIDRHYLHQFITDVLTKLEKGVHGGREG